MKKKWSLIIIVMFRVKSSSQVQNGYNYDNLYSYGYLDFWWWTWKPDTSGI